MTAPTDFIDVPSGSLCGVSVSIACKGPNEDRSYFLEYGNQLDPDDYITAVTAVAGDELIAITNIVVIGRRFRFTLAGGTINQVSGVEFTITLKSGDVRTLVCVVSIKAQGVLQSGNVPVVMGSQGARGTQIWFSDSDPTSEFTPDDGSAVNNGDVVYSQSSNSFYVASYVNSVLTWTKTAAIITTVTAASPIDTATNTTTLGTVADNSIESKAVTDFFTVMSGRLCINRSMLSATPTQDGELYDNGALIGINYED